MKSTKIYTGIVNGLPVDPESLSCAYKYFEGQAVDITIEQHKTNRSSQQNRYYWSVVVGLLSEHTGYSPDEMHEILLSKFAEKKELKIKDETHLIASRSHKMKTDEFEKYVEQIRIWASSELQVLIPLPNESIEDL